jgi:MFS family permease
MAEEAAATPEELPPGWRERLEAIRKAGGALFATRTAILREELGQKRSHLGRGVVGLAVAAAFAIVALLVFTGFLAAVLAQLFESAALGLLVVFLLYALIAGISGAVGWKAMRRVRPGDFPVTREELRKDWDALQLAKEEEIFPRDERFGPEAAEERDAQRTDLLDEDLEARYRAEAE